MLKEQDQSKIKTELDQTHLETKNRLLEEVLTKKNKECDEMEKGNKQLISILEKYDEKLERMKEEI